MSSRRFQVVDVSKSAQKNKTGSKSKTSYDVSSLYSGTPERAARKAFSTLCTNKKIKGRCTLNVTVQEVGPGKVPLMYKNGSPKQFTYSLRRQKLLTPKTVDRNGTQVSYKYETVVRSTSNICTKNSKLRRCK
jgi:hypothetical protein